MQSESQTYSKVVRQLALPHDSNLISGTYSSIYMFFYPAFSYVQPVNLMLYATSYMWRKWGSEKEGHFPSY